VQVIGELDEKKREALHASWVKVNQDFGSIFTSLLPGTMAKLEPPEGQTFLAGLEVKVCPIFMNQSNQYKSIESPCTASNLTKVLDVSPMCLAVAVTLPVGAVICLYTVPCITWQSSRVLPAHMQRIY